MPQLQSTKCGANPQHTVRCENCGEVLKEPAPDTASKDSRSIRWVCDNCGQTHNQTVTV